MEKNGKFRGDASHCIEMQYEAIKVVPPPPPAALPSGAHIVLENVPGDLNMMPLLHEHFKQFGEVLSIHCIPKYSKALVDFKTRQSADIAAGQQVLGVPSITANVYGGPARFPAHLRLI